jgi:hypothetical protein
MSTKRAPKLRVAAEGLSAVVVDAAVTARAAAGAMAIEGTAEIVVAVVEAGRAAGNLVTNHFQALDAPFIRKGELSWLEDQALLFKNAKRNSLGKRSKKTKQQSAPSGTQRRTRRDLVTWTTTSTTVWLTTPMKKYFRRSMSRFSIPSYSKSHSS